MKKERPEKIANNESHGLPEDILSAADNYFSKINTDTNNRELLQHIIEIPGLTNRVVEVLQREESASNWPLKDEDLRQYISENCTQHGITLPDKPGDLKRWFSLVYLTSSILEKWPHWNVVRFEDITGEKNEFDEDYQLTH